MVDMMQIVCPPNGRRYRLFGLGDEHMQCVQAADGWIEQCKNALMEEFQVTSTSIRRGADTSSLWTPDNQYHGQFYAQYRMDANGAFLYGCDWCPRQMRVGDTYTRSAHIVIYDWQGNALSRYDQRSVLKMERYHAAYTFPQSGITVADVYELSWGGEEVYFYALGYGLVGWRNVRTEAGSFIGSYDGVVIQTPHPHPIPRPAVSPPPPVVVPLPQPIASGTRATLTTIPAQYVNLRATPNGADIGDLHRGDVVMLTGAQSGEWVELVTAANTRGWTSLQGGKVVFTPVDAPPAPSTPLEGIDVSVYQGAIDWQRVAAAGKAFAYIRATIGVSGIDVRFDDNATRALAAGLQVGFYCVFKPEIGGTAQAQHALNACARYPGAMLPIAIDFETAGADAQLTADRLYDMARTLEQGAGRKPALYTAQGYWSAAIIAAQHDDYFRTLPLWIANYGVSKPHLPRCWSTYWIWQYSSSGSVPGIGSPRCDLDRINPAYTLA